MRPPPDNLPAPPHSWTPARRLVRVLAAPVDRFLEVEAASGIVLLLAAAAALVLANTPGAAVYDAFWTTPLGLTLGPLTFERDLRWWVNDGLMTVFFFVVGLEIRRETHAGELSDLRRAALPLAAAVGGMLVPAAIYAALNAGRPTSVGWGVPMATDIAFAVGVLALLGDRVPPALRILLLALAVIDDLGAILVIALFYSDGVNFLALGAAGTGLAGLLALQVFGVRAVAAYVPLALVAWGATYASGVHPTIAGVLVGLLTPVRAWLGPHRFADTAEAAARDVREAAGTGVANLHAHLEAVARATREAVSPVERLEHALHGWVAWFVMPLFAFANAGVSLGSLNLAGDGWRVFVGIVGGLVVGKAVGVFAAARAATALGVAALPRGVRWADVSVVGGVAGIGFTMALFVAQLAFPPGEALETAKLAILAASAIAGVGGYVLGRLVLGTGKRAGGAATAAEAEASTEV
ncbi:MAG: Na+/H+ antiporter NhaA [Pseudomonadota bacterium]|nr:Na+/H+ antiporter NhaA [Pseudomonadota bacterium]